MNDAAYPDTGGRLARNSINTTRIVFFVVAAAAPLASVVGASPAAFAFGNGAGVPGVFLLRRAALPRLLGGLHRDEPLRGLGWRLLHLHRQGPRPPGRVAAAAMAILTYKAIQLAVYALVRRVRVRRSPSSASPSWGGPPSWC
ncbi:MAG: hypothetical protein U1E17_06975 [Geminicoccaceae bacterium]